MHHCQCSLPFERQELIFGEGDVIARLFQETITSEYEWPTSMPCGSGMPAADRIEGAEDGRRGSSERR
jgi:hypothetical protein